MNGGGDNAGGMGGRSSNAGHAGDAEPGAGEAGDGSGGAGVGGENAGGAGMSGSGSEGCAAGTYGPDCEPCDVGQFCEGGDAEPVDCAEVDGFDHDEDPASDCRSWTECPEGFLERAPGSATEDRVCVPPEWLTQHESEYAYSGVRSAAIDADGNVYVLATVSTATQGGNVLVVKLAALTGEVIGEHEIGTEGSEDAVRIAVSEAGDIFVLGSTTGELAASNPDAYVARDGYVSIGASDRSPAGIPSSGISST